MPKSRLSDAIGVQRVRVGNKAKSEAWLVKGSSCKYVLIAVFIIVGCFVAAIVATQITFVSEKHKLVQEEKAHQAMEVVLEKRFLEVGSLLENELRRRLKHTKMSDAVHATVQQSLDSVSFPDQTVFAGDAEFDQLVSGITNMASRVAGVMNTYSTQMKNEAARSEKLLQAIAKHLGGAETDTLLEDTAASDVKEQDDVREKLLAERASKVASSRSSMAHSGSLKDRAKQTKERLAKTGSGRIVGHPDSADGGEELDEAQALRASIREKMLRANKGKARMRKEKDLSSNRGSSDASPRKPTRGKSETQSGQAKNAGGDNADTDSDGTSDFIAGRDLQSLLFRFFMRLNKIDSVVFPDAVKSKITSIKEAHQEAVAKIEAESSTKRERSKKLQAHWDDTIDELQAALDQDGVAGVEVDELNHASWMVDELLKEMQNVIDVQDLQEPLFALEDKFKSGEDADAVYVMKELQKMARTGDLPYEWVFGGSTGLSGSQERHHHRRHHAPRGGNADDEDSEDDEDEPYDEGPIGMMGGAPQYMWWREYPRQVDNPHWKPPPGMLDNFEFLDREREETKHRREEELREGRHRRHRAHRNSDDDDTRGSNDDGDGEGDDQLAGGDLRHHGNRHEPHGHGRRNHTRPEGRPPRRGNSQKGRSRRWGDFGTDDESAASNFLKMHRSKRPGLGDKQDGRGGNLVGDLSASDSSDVLGDEEELRGRGGFRDAAKRHQRHAPPVPPNPRAPPSDDDSYADLASLDDDYANRPPLPPHARGADPRRGEGGEHPRLGADADDYSPSGGFHGADALENMDLDILEE